MKKKSLKNVKLLFKKEKISVLDNLERDHIKGGTLTISTQPAGCIVSTIIIGGTIVLSALGECGGGEDPC